MIIETGHIYHIYNRGNNRVKIFYNDENYFFFIKKIQTFVLPYADILAWCLMSDHFHLMVEINFMELNNITLNHSIGRMLSSYTRAINKQFNRVGSLFQKHTKANCLTENVGIAPAWYYTSGGVSINIRKPEREYPIVCMKYIHYNPVKAGIVNNPEDWVYCSYREYKGNKSINLTNTTIGREYFDLGES